MPLIGEQKVCALHAAVFDSFYADGGRYRRLSRNRRQVDAAHARPRGPGGRADAQLKSWTVLRRIRSCPTGGTGLAEAALVLVQTG